MLPLPRLSNPARSLLAAVLRHERSSPMKLHADVRWLGVRDAMLDPVLCPPVARSAPHRRKWEVARYAHAQWWNATDRSCRRAFSSK